MREEDLLVSNSNPMSGIADQGIAGDLRFEK